MGISICPARPERGNRYRYAASSPLWAVHPERTRHENIPACGDRHRLDARGLVHQDGENGIRDDVAAAGGNAYVSDLADADWFFGHVNYTAEAYRCP